MKELEVKQLTKEAFEKYGRYASLTEPDGVALGVGSPIRFYRDLLPLGCAEKLAASVTEVEPVPLSVDIMEYHTSNWEGFMTLDTDSYIAVAPATADGTLDVNDLEAFFVPQGTMVYIHPGVWHFAPYPTGDRTLHSLVLLPERTYANDCEKVMINGEKIFLKV